MIKQTRAGSEDLGRGTESRDTKGEEGRKKDIEGEVDGGREGCGRDGREG